MVDVLLASSLVRFMVIPSDATIDSRAERSAYAELLFEREFGMPAGSFILQLADDALDRAALACAIDRHALEMTIDDCGGASQVRTVVPLFVQVFNEVCRLLTTGALAIAEAGRITLGIFAGEEWRTVASRAYVPSDRSILAKMLQDYAPVLPEGGNCYLFDPAERLGRDVPEPWTLHIIPAGNASFPFAACGLVR
ncbi:hypothetical protein [Pseudothauera rhizosphaerae]|uniref:Uncharacterized protein n=1 Tax=Pseudothauera rhizosphaerae TaxID=2565932 RepID=A0A4S4A8B9_9RHOO|nr:hypothetical protein [Pseudothauera rhizosphaerae]THF54776.1 hypothetical protein E6O51_21390 [Pseudothauera rhizosphaerae]